VDQRLSQRRVTAMAAAAFVALGLLWALASPLMDSPDEPTHALRAAAVWEGTIHGTDEVVHRPPSATGSVETGTLTHLRVPQAYVDLQTMPDCYKFQDSIPATCAPSVSADQTVVPALTYVGTYQPTYYLLVGWPTRLFGPDRALYAMRALSALVGGVLLGLGVASAHRAARSPFAVVGAALAATPQALFLIGTINPSGLEIAAAFATWLGLIELVRRPGRPSRAVIAQVAITASLFAAIRPLSPIFLAILIAVVGLATLDRSRWRQLAGDRPVRVGAGVVVLATVASGIWVLSTHAYDAFTGVSIPGLSAGDAAREHLHLLGFRSRQMIGYFGNVDAPLPDAVVWLWIGAAGLLVAASLGVGRWLQRLAVVSLVVAVVVIPLASEMSRAGTYGFIWQGRYSLPLAVGVPVLAGWVIADRRSAAPSTVRRTIAGVVAVAVAAAQVVAHVAFMTRVVVGMPNPWWRYLTHTGWRPPLPAWVLLIWAVVSAVAYGAVLWVTGRNEPLSRGRRTRP
jgi:uncharacterized membrane protein